MKKYILDASVVLNFLLGENAVMSKKIIVLLKKVEKKKAKLHSSYLLPLEVGNGLRYTLIDKKLANEALVKFLDLPIEFFCFSAVHYEKIMQLSYKYKTSFYDASYHFLAILLKGIFLTADKKYFRKAEELGSIELL